MPLIDVAKLLYGTLFGGTVMPPQHKKANGDWVETGEINPLPSMITSSNIMQPTDIQSHYQQSVQTHNGVTIAPGGNISSSWIEVSGFDDLVIRFKNDASTLAYGDVHWSDDGSSVITADFAALPSNTSSLKTVVIPTKGKFFRLTLVNADNAAPHIMNASLYLKA